MTQLGVDQTEEPGCSFSVSGMTLTVAASGGTVSVDVDTSNGCTWSAASDSTFLHLSRASGTGSGSVEITVDANADSTSRLGNLTLAGTTIPVLQAGSSSTGGTEVTILVNGSFNAYPPWMDNGSPEFTAITDTFGHPPLQFRWLDNDIGAVTFPSNYSGIRSGGLALASYINGLGLTLGDKLDVIAHSHGGNVALEASYFLSRPYSHLINLGTPVNNDLRGLGGHGAVSHCQVSSYTDFTQFSGASPHQVEKYYEHLARAGIYAYHAAKAARDGDWSAFAYYSGLVAYHEAQAQLWWLSTKWELGARNRMFFGNQKHSDLHEPPIWNAIKNQCALN